MLKYVMTISLGLALLLSSCSQSTFGKFQVDGGLPSFIKMGETTRQEVFEKLGEPLVHRFTAGRETAIYNNERGQYFLLYGTYKGSELIIRFKNRVVTEAKIEKTGSGWGFFAPATANNPGSRRSSR